MQLALRHKKIVLGVTGGIAAYKSADLVRRLREAGASVQVVMTAHAQQFITKLTMQAVSGQLVRDSLFDAAAEAAMGHIELARWADVIIVAPASADFMARLAGGRADDLLTTLCLATAAPIMLAPAMNQAMWKHTATQKNLQVLRERKTHIIGPAEGSQACGDIGPGRMLEPADIVQHIKNLFNTGALVGLRLLMTAGPTRELLDPVRFLSNSSSGKMGYALAQAAVEAGAKVTMISGPVVGLDRPPQVTIIDVVSAQDMYEAVIEKVAHCDIFMAVAAVADYRCKTIAPQKIHKKAAVLHLTLEPTPDIISAVAQRKKKPFIVGFAAETEKILANAKAKRIRKGMDVIIANQVGGGLGFDSNDNTVTVVWAEAGKCKSVVLPQTTKTKLARQLIHLTSVLYKKK